MPYLRTKNLENHTLFRGNNLHCPYMGVPRWAVDQLPQTVISIFWLQLCIWESPFLDISMVEKHHTGSDKARHKQDW